MEPTGDCITNVTPEIGITWDEEGKVLIVSNISEHTKLGAYPSDTAIPKDAIVDESCHVSGNTPSIICHGVALSCAGCTEN